MAVVGLADRLQQDMLPDRPLNFVDADGVPFIDLKITSRGTGHPPQQFLYQPAVDHVLREGVARFPNVEVLLEHECLRVMTKGDEVELMLADLRTDTFKRIRASYVIAAEGGSSPTRGQLGIGYSGRTYTERWVVIDTKVLQEWDGHDRLRFHCNPAVPPSTARHRSVTTDGSTPRARTRMSRNCLREDAIWKVLGDQGITPEHVEILRAVIYSHHVRVADRWRVGRVFLAGDAAHAMPPWIGQGMSAGCATWPTCAGNSPPCSGGRHRTRCSTPTRPNANRTSPRSPAAHASSAGSSPSATASSPPCAITCSVRWRECPVWTRCS